MRAPAPSLAEISQAFDARATCLASHCSFLDIFGRMGLALWKAKTIQSSLQAATVLLNHSMAGAAWGLFLFGRQTMSAQCATGGGRWQVFPDREIFPIDADGVFSWMFQTSQATVVMDPRGEARYRGEFSRHLGRTPATMVLYPVATENNPIGALVVFEPGKLALERGTSFQTLEAVSGLLAIALERLALDRKLRTLVYQDQLTGLGNRRVFDDVLDREVQRTKRHKTGFSLILIDLDKFKTINDTYGHKTGDEVLVAFGKMLTQSIRRGDSAVRLGGDEFALVLPNSSEDEANFVVQRLYQLARSSPLGLGSGNSRLEISFSAGIRFVDHENPEAIFNEADRQLYNNKAVRTCDLGSDILGQWKKEGIEQRNPYHKE